MLTPLSFLPEGYAPTEWWPEFDLPSTIPRFLHPERIGPPVGVRWGAWPYLFERFVSDTEPLPTPLTSKHFAIRIIEWQRLTRDERPSGWMQFSKRAAHRMGFAELSERYWEQWDRRARWDRKQWLGKMCDVTHTIENVPFSEFKNAYREGTLRGWVRHAMLSDLTMRTRSKSGNIRFTVAREKKTRNIVAGMAIIDSPTFRASCYHAGFVGKNAGRYPMTGLMDRWFEDSLASGFRFVHFGGFWQPGESKSRKGFSDFKGKFGVQYVDYPPMLYKFLSA
jgi:hypothetical protein